MKPTKRHLKKELIEALSNSLGNVTIACKLVGINRSTFYEWLKNDPEFKTEVEAIEEEALDFVEDALKKKIQQGDTTAIIFYLKCKGKKRGWNDKDINTQVNVYNGGILPEAFEIKDFSNVGLDINDDNDDE
jgi:transposase-like protein